MSLHSDAVLTVSAVLYFDLLFITGHFIHEFKFIPQSQHDRLVSPLPVLPTVPMTHNAHLSLQDVPQVLLSGSIF